MRSGELVAEGTPREIMASTGTASLEDAFLKIARKGKQAARRGIMKPLPGFRPGRAGKVRGTGRSRDRDMEEGREEEGPVEGVGP
jgi:hypothetical protein